MPKIKLVHIGEIQTSKTRQRQEFEGEAIAKLQDSIERVGLLHPIIIRVGEDKEPRLVAGERRLRALQNLWFIGGTLRLGEETIPEGMVPCVDLGDLDELAREEAEYDENTKREDLTWQESADATARLDRIKTLRSAERIPPAVDDLTNDRGLSIGGSGSERIRRELIVSKHLSDPDVAKSKTLEEAFKILQRKEETQRNTALGLEVGRTFTADAHQAFNEDAFSWLANCPEEQFDVILTDPPYGMGADEFGDSGGAGGVVGAHGYEDTEDNFNKILTCCVFNFERIAKPQAHLYWFCDIDMFDRSRELFFECGWQVHRTPLIWHKPASSRVPWPEHGPQRKYELILYAVKGKRKTNMIAPDLVAFNPDSNLGHSAQKPVGLFAELLRRSVRPGDSVLDPFCGTGPIFPAAHELKCRATGIEKDTGHYGIAVQRVERLKQQGELKL